MKYKFISCVHLQIAFCIEDFSEHGQAVPERAQIKFLCSYKLSNLEMYSNDTRK